MKDTLIGFGQGYKAAFNYGIKAYTKFGNYLHDEVLSRVLNVLKYVLDAPLWVLEGMRYPLELSHVVTKRIIIFNHIIGLIHNVIVKAHELTKVLLGMVFSTLKAVMLFDNELSDKLKLRPNPQYIDVFGNKKLFGVEVFGRGSTYEFLSNIIDKILDFFQGLFTVTLGGFAFMISMFTKILRVPLAYTISWIDVNLLSSFKNQLFLCEKVLYSLFDERQHVYWQLPLAIVIVPVRFVLALIKDMLLVMGKICEHAVRSHEEEIGNMLITKLNPLDVMGMRGTVPNAKPFNRYDGFFNSDEFQNEMDSPEEMSMHGHGMYSQGNGHKVQSRGDHERDLFGLGGGY